MKQPYIGNTKINKLYKGSELWCNWSSGGGKPVVPTDYVTDGLKICCDAYGKNSSNTFNGFYDSINNKFFNVNSGSGVYGNNCLDLESGYLIYGNNTNEYGNILKKSLANTSFDITFMCSTYKASWKTIFTLGTYASPPLSLKTNVNAISSNTALYVMNKHVETIKCLKKSTNWNNLIIVFDSNSLAKFYINGEYITESQFNGYDNDNEKYNLGLTIGAPGTNDRPKMSIGSFRMYSKSLSESEIVQNYNYEKSINRISNLTFEEIEETYELETPPIIDDEGEMS